MEREKIESRLRQECKETLVRLLTDVIRLCTYNRHANGEYERGWVDSRINLLDITGLDYYEEKEG